MIEFVNEEIEKLQKRVADELGFDLVDHRLELYGVPKGGRKNRALGVFMGTVPRRRSFFGAFLLITILGIPVQWLNVKLGPVGQARLSAPLSPPVLPPDGRAHPGQGHAR